MGLLKNFDLFGSSGIEWNLLHTNSIFNCFNGTALFLDVKILLSLGSEFSPKLGFEHWAILRFMILITNFLVLRSLFHGQMHMLLFSSISKA